MHIRRFSLPNVRVAMIAFAICFFAANAVATTEKVVYSFEGNPDGSSPQASLVADSAGNLYGTTLFGGDANFGTVFELSPPATVGGAWTGDHSPFVPGCLGE